MSQRKGIDATADEILRILEEHPDPPETLALQALQQAKDAGGGGLRQEHLKDAQQHIRRIDVRRNPRLVQQLQAEVLALQGRRGDTKIAHVTDNEIVLPPALQTPEIMNLLVGSARSQGIDPRSLFVDSGRNSINPDTGQMEFAEPPFAPPMGQIDEVTVTGKRPFSPGDVDPLTRLVYAEARGEGPEGWDRVIGTVLNRVGTKGFPSTVPEVISQNGQFDGVTKPAFSIDPTTLTPNTPDHTA